MAAPLRVTASELRARVGYYLDQVMRGRVVLVLRHGRPVAELRAPVEVEGELEAEGET